MKGSNLGGKLGTPFFYEEIRLPNLPPHSDPNFGAKMKTKKCSRLTAGREDRGWWASEPSVGTAPVLQLTGNDCLAGRPAGLTPKTAGECRLLQVFLILFMATSKCPNLT